MTRLLLIAMAVLAVPAGAEEPTREVARASIAQVRAGTALGQRGRVRIEGVVTYARQRSAAVRDGSGSLIVYLGAAGAPPEPGDRVEAIGWPAQTDSGMALANCAARTLSKGPAPEPIRTTAAEFVSSGVNVELVTLRARLSGVVISSRHANLVFDDGGTLFLVEAEGSEPELRRMFEPGSVWLVSGLGTMESRQQGGGAPTLRLRQRSRADLLLVEPRPWWTSPPLIWSAAIIAGLLAALVSWNFALKLQVRRQAAALRGQWESERALEERYREIFENSSDIVFACDLDGRVLAVNRAGERLLGRDRESLCGASLCELVEPGTCEGVRKWLAEARNSGAIAPRTDVTLVSRSGARSIVEVSAQVIAHPGQPARIEGIARDVSTQKAAQFALERAKEEAETVSRAKSDFLANMSHEIRTPMNGIVGLTELALTTELNPMQREYVLGVQHSAELLVAVINDMLDFSKIEAGKLELEEAPFDLRATLARAMQPLEAAARRRGLAFSSTIGAAVPRTVVGDSVRLLQVINNLVNNATKFTDSGGIEVEIDREQPRPDPQETRFAMRVSVKDTGIGIPHEKQATVFESFAQADTSTTRRYGGTGLGLSISARLVGMMRGKIWVESEPGQGSTFRFTVNLGVAASAAEPSSPAPPAASPAPVRATPAARMSGERGRVLLVEDNRMNQLVATRMLEQLGWAVAVASNGREAVEHWARAEFAAIFMDVQMPEMDGLEATRTIRVAEQTGPSRRPSTPIVAMTAHAMPGDRERCLAAGMDAYVSKPIQAAVLESVLQELGLAARTGRSRAASPGETI